MPDENEIKLMVDAADIDKKEEQQKSEQEQADETLKNKTDSLVKVINQENSKPIQPFFKSAYASVPLRNYGGLQYTGEIFIGEELQKMTVQFDTGSAIVYVLTDQCNEDCNEQQKYKLKKDNKTGSFLVHHKDGFEAQVDDMMGRMEYGYGSGYINGFLATEKICFSKEKDAAPCISAVKMIEADQATGVSKDKFAGIVGLSPRSSEANLEAFLAQVHDLNVVSSSEQLSPLFSIFLAKNSDEDGMITFGGYDIAKYAKPGLT